MLFGMGSLRKGDATLQRCSALVARWRLHSIRFRCASDDFGAKNRGIARATKLRSKMSRSSRSGRGLHRWRAALIVFIVVPAILCACAIRFARASSYTVQPILCDGVDDDTSGSFLLGLAEETTKRLSSREPGASPSARVSCSRSSVLPLPAGIRPLRSSAGSPARLKRMLALGARPSGDPDDPH